MWLACITQLNGVRNVTKKGTRMNANELADDLEFVYSENKQDSKTIKQAATMLRTIPALQAEIEALKTKWLEACDAIIEVGKRKAQEKC